MVELKQLSVNMGTNEYRMMKDIHDGENGFFNPVFNMTYAGYKDWLVQENNRSDGNNLPDKWVSYTTYVLYVDAEPIGYGRIRHFETETLKGSGCGPIGYAIAKEHRGKGYGTILLRMLLEKCRQFGYKAIQLYPEKENVPSIKAMKTCGGEIVGTLFAHDLIWNEQNQCTDEVETETTKMIVFIDLMRGLHG